MNASTKGFFVGVTVSIASLSNGFVTDAFGQAANITATWIGPDTLGAGGNWNAGENWAPSSDPQWPSAEGAGATFNGPAAARTINLAESITVGSIVFNNETGFDSTLANGGGGLTFDAVSGSPMFEVNGAGSSRVTISGTTTLNETLIANVSNSGYTGTTGPLNWTGVIADASNGGFTKNGSGKLTFGSGSKNYHGPTVLNSGVVRMSLAARPHNTSTFTINGDAQLELISDGDYTFGPGALILNGTGPAGNPGTIRPNRDTTTGRKLTITNDVQLQSTAIIHSQTQNGSTTPGDGRITFTGVISGPGTLQLSAPLHDENLGTYHLTATNTYTGGTELYGGRLIVGDLASGFPSASLGTGNVTVFNAALVNGSARSQLTIPTGALDAIADSATLTLGGGMNGFSQLSGFAELGTGVNEFVGAVVLGSTMYTTPGTTFGRVGIGATIESDEFFIGDGIITIAALAGVPGDFNGNGIVDAADYVLWRKGGPLQNEVSNSGTVDEQDYLDWRAHFGNSGSGSGSGLQAAGGVPEPATIALVGLGVTLVGFSRRRRVALHA